jgi:hypothetical protein
MQNAKSLQRLPLLHALNLNIGQNYFAARGSELSVLR